jgi:hypothetical protein
VPVVVRSFGEKDESIDDLNIYRNVEVHHERNFRYAGA